MSRFLFKCPCCGLVGATSDTDLEFFDVPSDEDDFEVETEYFDEDQYTSPESYSNETVVIQAEPPIEFPNRSERDYPVTADEIETRDDGKTVAVNHGRGARTGSITTETTYNQAPTPLVRQKPRRGQMQPPGPMAGCFKPQRQNIHASAHGVITDPNNAMNDFNPDDGMSAVERYVDNGLQYAYEADLAARGFH